MSSRVANISVLRAASDLISRAGLAARASLTFRGKRDLYEALGYARELRPANFRSRYRRNGVAARVVEAMPHATWRGGAELIENEDPDTITPFEEVWGDLSQRLQVWPTFARLDILAGLGRYAVLLVGAPGKLDEPLPDTLTPENIVYLAPYAEDDAKVEKWNEDTASDRFGLPEMYALSRTLEGERQRTSVKRSVHWSRVLHVADGYIDDRVFGQPRLERVWNLIDDLEKVTGAGAEAFWLRAHQGYHFDLDPAMKIDPTEKDKMKDAAEEFAHGLRRTLATRGMDVTAFGSDVANFASPVDALMGLISSSTGIPKRILMGSERGELASSQDKGNWDERVSDRRRDFAEPQVVRPFVQMLIERGALPQVEYDIRWPELTELDEEQKADIAVKWSELNGKAGGVVVTPAEIRDRVLGLDALTPEEIEENTPEPIIEPPPGEEEELEETQQPRAARGKGPPRGSRGIAASTGWLTPTRIRLPR
jgi:uncharacterized protein